MPTVSSTDGSETSTCWKRRSSAASFSMCSRYSSSVVAPTMRSSPRASIGLSMLLASIAPSPVAPAPTTVCSSSMKVMTAPPASLISFRTALSLSSNSPRYFAPATIAPRSRATSRLPRRDSGTSPATTRCASPSTTAVLPTPGSPMSTGLFFVRRDSTWITRRISASRPMTGSILPSRARSVRSTPYFSRAWNVPSGSGLVTRCEPRSDASASRSAAGGAPLTTPWSASAISRCSVETYSSERSRASRSAALRTARNPRDGWGAATVEPAAAGNASTWRWIAARAASGSTPTADSSGRVSPSASSSRTTARCAGSTAGLPRSAADFTAVETACWLRVVRSMGVGSPRSKLDCRGATGWRPPGATNAKLSLFRSTLGWWAGPRARRRRGAEVVAALALHVVGTPSAAVRDVHHARDVLTAVHVRLVDRDDHPPLGLAPLHLLGGQVGHAVAQRFVVDDARRAVDVQADQLADEVDHQDADVRVLDDVAQARHHPVAAVFGVRDRPLVDHVQEPGRPGTEARIALAGPVRGRDERHVLPSDELAHRGIEVVEYLIAIEAIGTCGGLIATLQVTLGCAAGLGVLGGFARRGRRHVTPRVIAVTRTPDAPASAFPRGGVTDSRQPVTPRVRSKGTRSDMRGSRPDWPEGRGSGPRTRR